MKQCFIKKEVDEMKNEAIKIENMTVAYEAEPVLWNIDVAFQKGQLTAILGPNGAGKSSLLNAMLGLVKPVSGNIKFLQNDGDWGSFQQVQKHVAYVPQRSSVDWDFPTDVLDVVVMGRYAHLGWLKRPRKKDYNIAKEKLEQVGMLSYQNRQISQLSGGQRQRVFLARALAQEADFYLLDEPLAGVDIKTEKIIINLLEELVQDGKMVVVVHHDLQTVEEYFDRVIFLNHEIIDSGATTSTFTEENIEETYRRDRNAEGIEST
jgi:manganese/zinc/iron transport system ATP- binding protein